MTPRPITAPTLARVTGLGFAILAFAACGSSDGGGDDNSPDFNVAVDTAPATTLGTASTLTVKLRSTGFEGPVTLALLGAPVTWTIGNPDSPVTLAANDSATATITVTVPSTGAAAPAGQSLTVDATAEGLHHTASTPFTVAAEYVFHFGAGAWTGPHWGAAQGTGVHLINGTLVRFQNGDTVAHTIHAGGGVGIAHQSIGGIGIAPGASYTGTISAAPGTSDLVSCHAHNHSDTLRITVQ